MDDSLDFFIKLLNSQNTQVIFLSKPYENISEIDYNFRRLITGDEKKYLKIIEWIKSIKDPSIIYVTQDKYMFNYVILKIKDESYMSIGPVLFEKPSEDFIFNKLFLNLSHENLKKELIAFYNDIPYFENRERFYSLLSFLLPDILKRELTIHFTDASSIDDDIHVNQESDYMSNPDSPEITMIKKRYEIENQLLDAVQNGDNEKAVQFYRVMMQQKFDQRNPNIIRNVKNYLIVFNTLLRKTVELSGIHPYYINKTSMLIGNSIEGCTSILQLNNLSLTMIKEYCNLVRNHKSAGYSEHVQKIIDYIDFHFNEFIVLQDLSDLTGLNATYLSALFSKQTGKPITYYINKVKIDHALPLLKNTTKSIEEISAYCGFEDMNYFARIFRKYTGKSPTAWRKQHLHQD